MPRKANAKKAEPISAEEKIARLLALLATKDLAESKEKIVTLLAAGFTPAEAANLLHMNEGAVNKAIYRASVKK